LRSTAHLARGIGRTDCHFVFAGDGKARVHAIRLAAELGISERVSLPGWASQAMNGLPARGVAGLAAKGA
jgi:hypothetical protein